MILRHGYLETYLCWMTVEIFYLGVDVMMFYFATMFWENYYLPMFGDSLKM